MAVTVWFSPWILFASIATGISLFLAIYMLWTLTITRKAWKYCGHYVHCFPRVPLLGNASHLINIRSSTEMWDFITKNTEQYKQGCMFWLLHIPWLLVSELDVVEAVLTSSESIEKSHVYRLLDIITDGVFSANGPRWKKLRKKLNLTFSPKQIDMIYEDVNEQTAVCIEVLKKNTGKYINIASFMTTYFFDIICRTHFDSKTNEQTNRSLYLTEIAAKVIELALEQRFFKPQNHILKIFQLTRAHLFANHMSEEIIDFSRNLVSNRLKVIENEKTNDVSEDKKRLCYVDGVKEALEELKMPASVNHIERNTGDMLVAASDTTSVAVSAAFYYLALYPDIQEKVYQEMLPIFGDRSTMNLTKEDLNRMEYLEMVIKETLRHAAPPGIVRELSRDLDVGKYRIIKGTNVYLAMKTIHKSPQYYERATEFYPEHFTADRVRERPKYAFLPFSHGQRNCPGMTYSYVTMKSIISSVIRNFKLETNIPLKDITYKMILMTEHKNGYFIKLTPRQILLDHKHNYTS